jgi:hypothetical protein
MANQRFPGSAGRVETQMKAVVLLVAVPRTDQTFWKVETWFQR